MSKNIACAVPCSTIPSILAYLGGYNFDQRGTVVVGVFVFSILLGIVGFMLPQMLKDLYDL